MLLKIEAGMCQPEVVARHVHEVVGDDVEVEEACVVSSKVDVLVILSGTVRKVGRAVVALMSGVVPEVGREPARPPDEVHRFFLSAGVEVKPRPASDRAEAYVDVKVLPGQKEDVLRRIKTGRTVRRIWSIENRDRLLVHLSAGTLGELHAFVLDELAKNTEGVSFTRTYDVMRRPKAAPPRKAHPGQVEALFMVECGSAVDDRVVDHVSALLPPIDAAADRPHCVLVTGAADIFAWASGSAEDVGERLIRLMREKLPRGAPPFAVHVLVTEASTSLPMTPRYDDEAVVFFEVAGRIPDELSWKKGRLSSHVLAANVPEGDIRVHGLRGLANRPVLLAHVSYRTRRVLRKWILDVHDVVESIDREKAPSPLVSRTTTHLLLPRPNRPALKSQVLKALADGPVPREEFQRLVDQSTARTGTKQNYLAKLVSDKVVEVEVREGREWVRRRSR